MAINYFISSYRVLYVMIWSFLRYFKNILHNFLETKSTKLKSTSDNEQLKKNSGSLVPFTQQRLHGTMTMKSRMNDQGAEEFHHEELFSDGNQPWTKFLTMNFSRNDTRILFAICHLSDLMVHGFVVSLTMELMRLFVVRRR